MAKSKIFEFTSGGFEGAIESGGIGQIGTGLGAIKAGNINAKLAEDLGRIRTSRVRSSGRKAIASSRARGAASGVDIQQGTPMDVLGEKLVEASHDVLLSKFAADFEAVQAKNDARRGLLGAVAGGINTATGFASGAFSTDAGQGFLKDFLGESNIIKVGGET